MSAEKISKQTKQIIVFVIVCLVVIFLVKRFLKGGEQDSIESGSNSDGTPKASSSSTSIPAWQKKYNALPSVGEDGLLKSGMKAQEIWTLQSLYNTKIANPTGKTKLVVDGIFGAKTLAAVKYVQENKYGYTHLKNWRKYVDMTKAARVAYFKTSTQASTFVPPTYDLNINPAESTFVAPTYGYPNY